MADEQRILHSTPTVDDDLTPTELAHSIIESLLVHTAVVSDLIALMAQALDQDRDDVARADGADDSTHGRLSGSGSRTLCLLVRC